MAETEEIIIDDMRIARSVLEKIVRESVGKVEDVAQLKHVGVEGKNHGIAVTLNLALKYKSIYPDAAGLVQNMVEADVNKMTGVPVKEVNVTVEKLEFGKE